MKKQVIYLFSLVMISTMAFYSCHTYVFDNVEEKIVGQWTMLPVSPGNNIQFNITSDSIFILENSSFVEMVNADGEDTYGAGYSIENSATNHYVIIDPQRIKDFGIKSSMFKRTKRWLVITLTEEELYLESLGRDGLKGEYQLHFYRNN